MRTGGSCTSAWYVLLPIGAFFIAWWGYIKALPYVQLPFDDSYIAQQYARHLLPTGMLTFDGIRPSRGATSPPHVFLLALSRQVVSDPVTAALLVGLVCHAGFLVLLFLLVRELGCRPGVAVAVLSAAASCGFLVFDSLNGLETSLFHLLGTAMVLIALRLRDTKGLILLTVVVWLVCWCRPEGVLLVGVFLLAFGWRLRSFGREHLVLVGLLALGPLLVLVGHLWPGQVHSWRIKMVFHGEAGLPLAEKVRIAAGGIGPFVYFLRWYLVIPFVALALQLFRRRSVRLIGQSLGCSSSAAGIPTWLSGVILGFVVAFYAVYTWCLPSSLYYLDFRYQHVLLPWVFVVTAWGFQALVSSVHSARIRRFMSILLVTTLFLGSVMTYIGSRRVYAACVRSVENVLIPLAGRLRQIAGPEEVIVTHDVGVLGYYSGQSIVDLVGLTEPEQRFMFREASHATRDQVLRAGRGFLVIQASWDELYLHINPDSPDSGFRYSFETEPAFGDRYRIYHFGY